MLTVYAGEYIHGTLDFPVVFVACCRRLSKASVEGAAQHQATTQHGGRCQLKLCQSPHTCAHICRGSLPSEGVFVRFPHTNRQHRICTKACMPQTRTRTHTPLNAELLVIRRLERSGDFVGSPQKRREFRRHLGHHPALSVGKHGPLGRARSRLAALLPQPFLPRISHRWRCAGWLPLSCDFSRAEGREAHNLHRRGRATLPKPPTPAAQKNSPSQCTFKLCRPPPSGRFRSKTSFSNNHVPLDAKGRAALERAATCGHGAVKASVGELAENAGAPSPQI